VLGLRWRSVRPPDRAVGGSGQGVRGIWSEESSSCWSLLGYGDKADECLGSVRRFVHWRAV